MTTRKRRTKAELLQHLEEKRERLEFEIAHERSPFVRDLLTLQNALGKVLRDAPLPEVQERAKEWYQEVTLLMDDAVTVAMENPPAE